MFATLLLVEALLCAPHATLMTMSLQAAALPSIDGEWRGSLTPAPGASIPLVLRVAGSPGKWTATLDSPAQGATGLVVQSVTHQDGKFRFVLAAPQAEFEGALSADGKVLSGKWTQGGASLPLTMAKRTTG